MPKESSLEITNLCQTLSKAFDMSRAITKVSPKSLREDDHVLDKNERRSTVERLLRKPYWQSERRFLEVTCFWIFSLRIVSRTLESTD